MANKKFQRLLVVNGTFSFIHALAAAPTREEEEIFVIVLFQYDDAQIALLERKICLLRPMANVKFLKTPSEYVSLLSNREWMHQFCPSATEIRMFFTHNNWLHNAVFGCYPDAEIIMFEEGSASFYPGLWKGLNANQRISKVSISHYLDRFNPLDRRGREDIFVEPSPKLLKTLLSRLSDATVEPPRLERPTIVLVEQYFHKKGKQIAFEELVELYHAALQNLLNAGYDVLYKGHPRENFGIWEQIEARLRAEELDHVRMVPREIEVLEAAIPAINPVAIVGVNSTSQLVCPHLFGIPSFRIETNIPIRMSRDIDVERCGLVCNHLAQTMIFPSVSALPPASMAHEAVAVFESHVGAALPNEAQPLIALLAENNFSTDLSALISDITDPSVKAVSFDVFDTLVWRPSLHPSDIFQLLDKEFHDELGGFLRYSALRSNVFGPLRNRDRRKGSEKEEYSLSEIYDFLGEYYGLSRDLTVRMHQAELALEKRLLQPRQLALALLKLVKDNGKRIILTSDTYFTSDELKNFVAPFLPYNLDLILTSLDEGVTKRNGALFDVLMERLSLNAEEIVHLGDSKVGDVDRPNDKGIRAHHFPAFNECMRSHPVGRVFDKQRLELGAKLVTGLFAGRFFDNPFALRRQDSYVDGSAFWLGYGAVGPMLFAWVRWLLDLAVDRGNDKLLFVARDGFVPLTISERFKAQSPKYDGVRCEYVYASRKAYMPLFQARAADVAMTRFAHGLDPNTNSVERALRTRFGPQAHDRFKELFELGGFEDLRAPIRRDRYETFNEILASIADEIVELQASNRVAAEAYFREILADSTAPAIVDIGYSGSSQRAFILGSGRRVDGYYLTIMEHNVEYSELLDYRAHDFSGEEQFFRNGAFMEYLITPAGLPECVGYSMKEDGTSVPVFRSCPENDPVSEEIQAGVNAFLDDVFRLFGSNILAVKQRPAHAVRMMAAFVSTPAKGDAEMFVSCIQEDEIGAARPKLLDYWPAGKAALSS